MFAFLNTVAIANASTAALPFGTIVIVLALFVLVNLPLTVLGGVAGRNIAVDFKAPCRTTKVRPHPRTPAPPHPRTPAVRLCTRRSCRLTPHRHLLPQMPRQIPEVPFYRSGGAQVLLAGFLPFSAISIELHYIFASVWGHKVYTLFGILFLAFVLCTVVTSFIVIALTYFQLAVEDHRWCAHTHTHTRTPCVRLHTRVHTLARTRPSPAHCTRADCPRVASVLLPCVLDRRASGGGARL